MVYSTHTPYPETIIFQDRSSSTIFQDPLVNRAYLLLTQMDVCFKLPECGFVIWIFVPPLPFRLPGWEFVHVSCFNINYCWKGNALQDVII